MRRLPRFLFWLVLGLAAGVLYWHLLKQDGATWGIWTSALALSAISLKLISYADDLLRKALAAMWRPLILIGAAAYLLFSNDQGRELGVSLMAEKSGWRLFFLFLVLIYWAANNWHTARLGLDVAFENPRGDEKWLFWPPRLLGVCAHLFAAINLSLAAANQPEFAASGRWWWAWSAPFFIVLAAAVLWGDDHFLLSERTGHAATTKTKTCAAAAVAFFLFVIIAIGVLSVPGAPAGFSWGTISISASAIAFFRRAISWLHHKKPSRRNAPADDAKLGRVGELGAHRRGEAVAELRGISGFFDRLAARVAKMVSAAGPKRRVTAGLFFMAVVFACATWWFTPVVVGRVCGSMVVAYFAFGAILALVNAFELVVSRVTKKWFADKVGAGVVGTYAVAFLIGLAVLNTWPQPFHRVRLCDGGDCVAPPTPADFTVVTSPDERPTVAAAARAWYEQAKAAHVKVGRPGPVPMLIVAAAGGGIRAAYWTATVLEKLGGDFEEDNSFEKEGGVRPYLFAISGVSGGSVGAAAFEAALAQRDEEQCKAGAAKCPLATTFLSADFLAPALASLVFVDTPTSFLPDFGQENRGTALERSFETESGGLLTRPFLSLFHYKKDPAAKEPALWRPILLLNATHQETGKRIITGHVLIERNVFIDSLDALHVLGKDVRVSTAAHNSARFSYISPAGALGNDHGWVIDGGYFENYGALSALELARAARWELRNETNPGVKLVILMISSDPDLQRAHELVRIREAGNSGKCLVSVTEREGTSSADASGSQKSAQLPNYLSIDKEQAGNAWINEFVAPFQGITKVREAHGNRAAAELAVEICSEFSEPLKATSGVPSALQSQALAVTSLSPQTQTAAALDNAKDENVNDSPPVQASHQNPYFAHLAMCKEGQPAPVQAPLGWVLSNATQQAFGKLLQQCGNDHELSQLEIALGRQAKQRVAGPSAE